MLPKNVTIVPSEGLGHSIKLGNSLYDIVNRCRSLNTQMQILYSENQYLETPITIILPELGFRLIFENSFQQELVLIEVISFVNILYLYKGVVLNKVEDSIVPEDNVSPEIANGSGKEYRSASCGTSCEEQKVIGSTNSRIIPSVQFIYNKVFGPTYPGTLIDDSYVISYPGIAFRFKIELQKLLSKLQEGNSSQALSELLRWPKQEDVVCVSFSIFNGESWDSFFNGFKIYLNECKNNRLRDLPHFKHSKLTTKSNKVEVDLNSSLITCNIAGKNKPLNFQLGKTTQQQVIGMLGPPEDYFNKFDSRLNIHNHMRQQDENERNSNSIEKFHNYYQMGLDFLYELNPQDETGKTGVLKKVIVHNGGIIDSLDFMKWGKCNWIVKKDGVSANSEMYFHEIPRHLIDPSENQAVLLNRNETELFDDDLDIIGTNDIPHELLGSPACEPKDMKVYTWGESLLYGGARCIWEVTKDTKCVSSLTIY